MNTKLKTTKVAIETEYEGIILKGELEFSAKEYELRLLEPCEANTGYRLILFAPVIYVLEKSKKPRCHEIELLELSKEKLKELYLKNKKG